MKWFELSLIAASFIVICLGGWGLSVGFNIDYTSGCVIAGGLFILGMLAGRGVI